jgi:inner membrane protein
MDSITQAVLGASIGQAILGKKIGSKGAILGAIVATIPDLDILLLPLYNSVERISVHRGYSHSILFSIIGALLIAYLLTKLKWTKEFSFNRLALFSWLALFTHMLLDAFTAYGTQLFLPFSNYRVSFDSVNIVDPVYTVPLMIGLFITIFYQKKKQQWSIANTIGLCVSTLYLLFTLVHKQTITADIEKRLQAQQINYDAVKSIPVGVGNMNWYGVAKTADTLYIGKYSRNDKMIFHSFPVNSQLLNGINADLAEQLKWFAQDFYIVAADSGKVRLYNLQCDMQGVRTYGKYKAPTAFYFEVENKENGEFELSTGMHKKE